MGARLVLPWAQSADPEANSTLEVYQNEPVIPREIPVLARLEKVRFVPLELPTARLEEPRVGLEDEEVLRMVLGDRDRREMLQTRGWAAVEDREETVFVLDLTQKRPMPAALHLQEGLPEPSGLPEATHVVSLGRKLPEIRRVWKQHPIRYGDMIFWNADYTTNRQARELTPIHIPALRTVAKVVAQERFDLLAFLAEIGTQWAGEFGEIFEIRSVRVNYLRANDTDYAILRAV